jgi:L-ascorbate metabolism protein UlaG (beta-lactamase superfamily)
MLEYKGVKVTWLGHDTFRISDGSTVYIDPYRLDKEQSIKADILLISHEHFDHLSKDDIKKVIKDDTVIITTDKCASELKGIKVKEVKAVKPWDKVSIKGIDVEAVPAYNTNKINPDTKKPFHPKEANMLGFIVTINGVRIYHAGDTDAIEEMKRFSNIDIALLPVSGTYVMTADEAVQAVNMIKPKIAVPMHYGTIVGSEDDANRFKDLVKVCEVNILKVER